jgi:hypothetical protein
MAQRRPGVISVGTPRDGDKALGYVASGSSEFTRHSAHSQNTKLASYHESKPKVRGPRSPTQLIAENIKALEKLKWQASRETNPERKTKLEKSIEIKSRFLATLQRDNAGGQMQARRPGRVVEVSEDQTSGVISAGGRYHFLMTAADEQLGKGDLVEFVSVGDKATRIKLSVQLLPSELEV